MSAYPSPPLKESLDDALLERIDCSLWDARPPAGPLAAQLGPQFTLGEVSSVDDYIDDERVHSFVRAFPVPCLAGVELEAPDEQSLPESIAVTLHRLLPGIDWRLERDVSGPLRKYGLLHASIIAPPDEATGQPMALELLGDLVSAGDVFAPGDDWFEYRLDQFRADPDLLVPVPGPVVVRLKQAVYANVLYPGIGVPFYM